MWTHESSIDTQASAERIWRLFTDLANWHRWNPGVQHAALDGSFAEGQTFRMQLPGDEPALTSTLRHVQPGRSFTDETVLGDTCVCVAHTLEPLAEGGTRIVYRTEVRGPDAAQIGAMVCEDFSQVLASLRRHAEAAPNDAMATTTAGEPYRCWHDAFTVSGHTVRTTNADEMDPKRSRIGPLWDRFFADAALQALPQRIDATRNYGIYSGYASDARGAFDVTAGVAVDPARAPRGNVTVEAGDYLVWRGEGLMPDAVIGAWHRIWQYFDTHPEVVRRFRSDFETYTSSTEVHIHIGIAR